MRRRRGRRRWRRRRRREIVDRGCKIGATAVEVIADGLRRGNGFKEIVDDVGGGLDSACEVAVKVFIQQPGKLVDVTITDPTGSAVTEQLKGRTLLEMAPESPGGGPRSCANYTVYLLWRLCINEQLQAIRRSLGQ
jgi:hypothetical protein